MGQGEALCSAPFKRSRAPRGQALATDQRASASPGAAQRPRSRCVDRLQGYGIERKTAPRRADFLELPKDEYYWTDLIGLQVINTAGEILGIVRNLLDHGAHAVLCVEPHASNAASAGQNRELLIPFVNAYILEVDLGHHQMIVDWRSDWDG